MIFANPEILRNCDDVKIGGIQVSQPAISYLSYIAAVRLRIFRLVIEFVKSDMADGASKEDSIKDCLSLIHETLVFDEVSYPTDEAGLVEEIMNSEEFKNWSTDIKYRFLNVHVGVIELKTEIPVSNNTNPNVMNETLELVETEDSLQVLLDGLAATNYID